MLIALARDRVRILSANLRLVLHNNLSPNKNNGGEGGIRTHGGRLTLTGFQDRHLQPLGHLSAGLLCSCSRFWGVSVAEREGFEPSVPVSQYTRLAGEHLQPLGHLSGYLTLEF